MYDPVTRFGGLAHILLPQKKSAKNSNPGKYVETAIPYMLRKFEEELIPTSRLEAKIVGGASMFSSDVKSQIFNIGERNIEKAVYLLKIAGVTIINKDIGKDISRMMFFFQSNGLVLIREPITGEEWVI
jgi:chemotaxis protein CheD